LDTFERDSIASALRRFDKERYELTVFVVMNDHVHAILNCLDSHSLERIIHTWKSFTANYLQRTTQRKGSLWQDEYFDRAIRDEREFNDKLTYILNNPTKRWPEIRDYRWLYVRPSK